MVNKKIKDLAFQAGFVGENMYPVFATCQETALNNFAQLIIQNYCSSHKFTKNPWITEYPGEVFVVFDPMTDGSGILGAARTFDEAQNIFDYCDSNRERQYS